MTPADDLIADLIAAHPHLDVPASRLRMRCLRDAVSTDLIACQAVGQRPGDVAMARAARRAARVVHELASELGLDETTWPHLIGVRERGRRPPSKPKVPSSAAGASQGADDGA